MSAVETAQQWLARQKADSGEALLDEGDCRICGNPAAKGHDPTDPCGIVENLLAVYADAVKALRTLNAGLQQVDNGRCAICRIGYRTYGGRRKPKPLDNCSNERCVSHAVAEVLG